MKQAIINRPFRARHLKADYYEGELIPKGEWLYGWYYPNQLHAKVEYRIILPRKEGLQGQAELDIDPNTLGRAIGAVDVNGKQIYEGDIIVDESNDVYEICWYDELCAFIAEMVCNEKPFMINDIEPETCRVIGNIHDNPELLK